MPSRKLYLRESEIEHVITHCCNSNIPRIKQKVVTSNQKELRIEIRFDDLSYDKEKPGILLFNFNNGKTSCQIIGNHRYTDIGNSIIDEIEKQAGCPSLDFSSKHVTLHNVTQDEYEGLILCLQDVKHYTITKHTAKHDPRISSSHTVSSLYNSSLKLTHYSTNTLLLQGSVSSLFVEIYNTTEDLLSKGSDLAEGTFIALLSHPSHEFISPDLTTHFKDLTKFQRTKCEHLLNTSIAFLNSDIVVEDYSSMTHGIFRTIEALIAKKITEVTGSAYVNTDMIGRDFNNRVEPIEYKSSFVALDSKPHLKNAILRAYRHYHKHRHETFHADIKIPLNTRIINRKEDAIDLAKDSIKLISDIIDYWDE